MPVPWVRLYENVLRDSEAAVLFFHSSFTDVALEAAAQVPTCRVLVQVDDGSDRPLAAGAAAYEALDEHFRAALNMITAPETKKAFDLDSESDKLRDAYGRTKFGQSCLLARRLIESGTRFVTVTDGGVNKPVTVTVLDAYYGSDYAIAFKPSGWRSAAGHTYHVVIGGTSIAYDVEMVDCGT